MLKIVMIEDEFDIRDAVMSWLQFEGYTVFGAENGKQGLQIIYQENPDLVLCDISMPEMDGHAVLIELRSDSRFAHLPFIFLTAAVDHDSIRQGMNLGADDYITKPFNQGEVLAAVRTRLGKQEQIQAQIDHLSDLIGVEREQRLLKSRLVGMFSHDFRNPLASILASSNMLQAYFDRMNPQQRDRHFHRINGSVQLLLQMLDEMLLVAEIENGQLSYHPQVLDLQELVRKIVADFQLIDGDSHQLRVSIRLPQRVLLDPKLVQHIITNLISNALKYSPEGSEVRLQAAVDGEQIMIAVQDAGVGIPEDALARIFDPFFRADNVQHIKGTGLGLALAQESVTLCGGSITATSDPGAGSCFTVRLPLIIPAEA